MRPPWRTTWRTKVRRRCGGPLIWDAEETKLRLQDSLKELRLLGEKLRRQNRRLTAAHHKVQADCQRYRELFDLAPDGYVMTDTEGVIRESNCAAAALLRVERHRL